MVYDDFEKEFIRKLNFSLLTSAFDAIADNHFNKLSADDYKAIPMNDERLFDLLIKNINIEKNGQQYKIDIGIHRTEESIEHGTVFFAKGEITDIGDLKDWYGFTELDGLDLIAQPGLVWQEPFAEIEDINANNATELVKQGYIFVKVLQTCNESYIELPINVVPDNFIPDSGPVFEGRANFLLKSSLGELKYVVINGFLWKLDEPLPDNINGLVF